MSEKFDSFKQKFNYVKLRDPENLLLVKPFQTALTSCRLENLKVIMKNIKEVRADLESLKCEVSNVTETETTDYIRQKMFKVEQEIGNLKCTIKEKFFTLLRDEAILEKELQFMMKRIEDWDRPLDINIFKAVRKSIYKIKETKSENAAVELQKFLLGTGGHCGGWEEQDHLLFLKERMKHKGKDSFLFSLRSLLPDLDYETIEQHEKWYQKYLELKDSQKEAIQKWKLEKENQKKKKREKEKRKEVKTEVKKVVQQQIQIAERIKEWKVQQLLRKLEEEEIQKKEKEKLKEEEKRKKKLQEMKKLAVIEYKAEKLKKVQEDFPKENLTQQAKAKNKVLLKAFRLQDLKFVEKKKTIRLEIESKSKEKMERIRLGKPALELILKRDPRRIFQPTLIWSQHCLESEKKEKVNPVFDLNSIPRLAIPEWRRELM